MSKNTSRLLSLGLLLGALGMAWLAWNAYFTVSITVEWSTATELETAGFNVYRRDQPDREPVRLNATLIPASDDPLQGGDYSLEDPDVEPGRTYTYTLEEVELSGMATQAATTTIAAERGGIREAAGAVFLMAAAAFVFIRSRSSPQATAAAA